MKEKPVDGQAAVTLKAFSPHVGDSVRRMLLGRRIGRYPEPLLWQVLGIETSGCVVALNFRHRGSGIDNCGDSLVEWVITLEEFSLRVGDSVRRMLQDRNGRYYPEPLVCQVRSVDNHGCVIALVAGQGHASHKYLMEWFTRVQPWA